MSSGYRHESWQKSSESDVLGWAAIARASVKWAECPSSGIRRALHFSAMGNTIGSEYLNWLYSLTPTMPLSTHAVKLDLPVGKPAQPIDPVVNRVAVSASGEASWNGAPVSRAELRRLMADSGAMAVEPEMHLLPDAEAPYAAVDSILADAKRAEVTKLGFVGNQAYQAAF